MDIKQDAQLTAGYLLAPNLHKAHRKQNTKSVSVWVFGGVKKWHFALKEMSMFKKTPFNIHFAANFHFFAIRKKFGFLEESSNVCQKTCFSWDSTILVEFCSKHATSCLKKIKSKLCNFAHCAIGNFYLKKPEHWINDFTSNDEIWAENDETLNFEKQSAFWKKN